MVSEILINNFPSLISNSVKWLNDAEAILLHLNFDIRHYYLEFTPQNASYEVIPFCYCTY